MIKLSEIPQAAAKGLSREFLFWLQESFTRINNKLDLLATAVAGNVVIVATDNDVDDSGKAAPSSDFVGTTDTQTLTNKTLTSPTIADFTNAQHDHQDADDGGKLDHGAALNGLTDDDHSGHPWLAGRSGGQTLNGGTASGDDLKLISTAHATKGSVYIGGDGGITNYSEFESDGTLRLVGAATVYDDLPPSAIISAKQGSSAPTLATFLGNIEQYTFDATNDYVIGATEITHKYKEGTNLHPHIHWVTNGSDVGNTG